MIVPCGDVDRGVRVIGDLLILTVAGRIGAFLDQQAQVEAARFCSVDVDYRRCVALFQRGGIIRVRVRVPHQHQIEIVVTAGVIVGRERHRLAGAAANAADFSLLQSAERVWYGGAVQSDKGIVPVDIRVRPAVFIVAQIDANLHALQGAADASGGAIIPGIQLDIAF